MKNVIAILQARMSSQRLPGKVLQPINNIPMLEFQLNRLKKAKNLGCIIVATSNHPSDDPIEQLCIKLGYQCYRGDLNDVLARYYQAANKYEANVVVRLTGDCPLIDPIIVDKVISFYHKSNYEYVSNVHPPTYPDGMDVEVFSKEVLLQAYNKANTSQEREHVTPYIVKNAHCGNVSNSKDLSHYRLTVDEKEDLELVRQIVKHFSNFDFSLDDLICLLDTDPDLKLLNAKFKRNENM